MRVSSGFQVPSFNLLDNPDSRKDATDTENLRMQSKLLEKKLDDFGVNGKVVTVTPGPVITTFEYEPAPGVKINKIVNLSDDLSLALRAASIRIVAPIPGKAVIGIEIPNSVRETVCFKEVVVSNAFEKSKSKLPLCLGKDIVGNPVVAELDKMPHLLIAGGDRLREKCGAQCDDLQFPVSRDAGSGPPDHGRSQTDRTLQLRRHTTPDHAGGNGC